MRKVKLYELAQPVDDEHQVYTDREKQPKAEPQREREPRNTALETLCDETIFYSGRLIDNLRSVIAGEYSSTPRVDHGEMMHIAESTERIALCARRIPPCAGNYREATPIENILREIYPIDIGYTEERWFCMRMPMLLPKKESKASREYLNSWLYPALSDYFRKLTTPVARRCVIIYRHVYEPARAKSMYRDHDNIEIKQVTDAIAMFLVVDDAPAYCCHYHCSARGNPARTEVYVVPKEDFKKWLALEPDFPSEGLELITPPEYVDKNICKNGAF